MKSLATLLLQRNAEVWLEVAAKSTRAQQWSNVRQYTIDMDIYSVSHSENHVKSSSTPLRFKMPVWLPTDR